MAATKSTSKRQKPIAKKTKPTRSDRQLNQALSALLSEWSCMNDKEDSQDLTNESDTAPSQ